MQDSPMGDVPAIFYTYTAYIYAFYRDGAAVGGIGWWMRPRKIEAADHTGRTLIVVPVCCHVHPGV